LHEAIDAGLMFDVLVNGDWAGYVGVHPDEHLGLLTYSVQELLLTPAYRGQGFGASLTTLLARAVLTVRPEEPGRVLLGTIHADNLGAYPAALRAGRHDVGGWVQLKF
jgi:GNAT superfamily N-acetyltransferase